MLLRLQKGPAKDCLGLRVERLKSFFLFEVFLAFESADRFRSCWLLSSCVALEVGSCIAGTSKSKASWDVVSKV